MTVRQWRGGRDWEEVKRIGGGGQSEVFLVRNAERIAERKKHLSKLMELAGQGFNDVRAEQFAEATLSYGRADQISELGAIKIYNPRAAGLAAEKQALERLRIETSVLGQGRTGLPRLLDSNEGARWIVTEYLPGGTLEDHVLDCMGNPLKCLTYFRPLVETVASLHKENIFHRDIKPANVFMGRDSGLILGDFGIAFLPDRPERVTFTNESVGPQHYMPPWAESEERLGEVGGNFDVYMLGKLLWCMVAGRLRLVREWYRKPEFDITLKFPDDPYMHSINAILDKCLVDDPDKCLPQASELLEIVDAHLSVMRRGGQMLRDGVPRPCRICGKGLYKAEGPDGRQAGTQLLNDNRVGVGVIYFRLLICDYCQHVELFKVSN
jgi:serine/threonine protein kinase